MTISTETVFTRTVGNGATTAFAFPYHFFENGDLVVYLETTADGTAVLQTISTHYTVSGADDPSGGTVTMLSAPASTKTVVIFRKPDFTQTVSFSSFVAGTANDALDRLYEHLQYQEWVKSRSIRLPDTMASATLTLPHASERAGKALVFDDDGNVTVDDKASDVLTPNLAAAAAAEASATAAAGSASSALSSANTATAQAVLATSDAAAADVSRLAASTSASTATTQASTATTKAGEAAASAAAALNSRNSAETFKDNAAASAAAALTSENNAELAETNAETAQAAAEVALAAAVVAQAATYLARDVAQAASENPGISLHFDSSTSDADPGTGDFRFNHATLASVTTVYADNADIQGTSYASWLDSFDDNNNTLFRGFLIFKGITTPGAFFIGKVTGSIVDGTGYRKVTVTHTSSGGTFTNGDTFSMLFSPAGSVGDILGPASSTTGNIPSFSDTSGKQLQDSGVSIANILTEAEAAAAYQPLTANLTEWSGLNPSANAGSLVTAADYAAMRALLDLEAGTDFLTPAAIAAAYQPLDAELTALAGSSANGVSLVTAANYAAMRALLDLEVGTDFYSIAAAEAAFLTPSEGNAAYQPLDADLSALAGNSTDGLWAHTGAGTGSARTITAGNGVAVTNGGGVAGNPTIAATEPFRAIADITGGGTIAATDQGGMVRIVTGTGTLAFTAAATLGANFSCTVKNAGTGDVTLDPNSTETIDGVANWILYPGGAVKLQCDGTNFFTTIIQPMVKTFDASGTFTKPGSASIIEVENWAGGGSGACGQATVAGGGAGGGGYNANKFLPSAVGATETVTIGDGGIAVSSTGNGNPGGNTTFGALLTAYGGGAGTAATPSSGGGGGGQISAGNAGGVAGEPRTDSVSTLSAQGSGSATVGGAGLHGNWHGGGGGAGDAATGGAGGNSLFGGAGGGAGGDTTAGGNGGTSQFGGNGGAGATGAAAASPGVQPGGGGGGSENTGAASGAGGKGRCRVRVY